MVDTARVFEQSASCRVRRRTSRSPDTRTRSTLVYTGTPVAATVRRPVDTDGSCSIPPTPTSSSARLRSPLRLLRQRQHPVECFGNSACRYAPRTLACDYDEIYSSLQPIPPLPEPLAHCSLDAVSDHRIAYAAAYRHAQSNLLICSRFLRSRQQYDKLAGLDPPPTARYPPKVPRRQKPVRSPKATGLRRHSYFDGVVTARRLRPFARLRFNTARPPRELMRARNP